MKFWNVTYLEEMDYNKQKKPGILPKTAVRYKSKKQNLLREAENQNHLLQLAQRGLSFAPRRSQSLDIPVTTSTSICPKLTVTGSSTT